MRKRLLLTLLIPMLLFVGCEDDITSDDTHYEELTENQFEHVKKSKNLYYDTETKIIYIIFREEKDADTKWASGFGYMSPYYAPNGKPYRYIDGELKEIEE